MNEYAQMKEVFENARLGSILLIPLEFDGEDFGGEWIDNNAEPLKIDTMDINQSVKNIINGQNSDRTLKRYRISEDTVLRELFRSSEINELYACEKETSEPCFDEEFSLLDLEVYVFHTGVAFLCVKLSYNKMKLLKTISNLGYITNDVHYYYRAADGKVDPFDLQAGLKKICAYMDLSPFYSEESSLFLEAYTYTFALVSERFRSLETIRQATFNLHLMVDLAEPAYDESEEDINFVYAVKEQSNDAYKWGVCVTGQTISYVVYDPELDVRVGADRESRDGVPLVLLALYQKYTSLRFKELASIVDGQKSKRIRELKKKLLDFQAYGVIAPSNISRWHNVRQIYHHVIESNGIKEAIEDISVTLNLLAERQREIDQAKSDTIMGLLTVFSVVSIPTSIIGLIDTMSGGNLMNIITTVITLISVGLFSLIVMLYKDRT